MDIGSLWDNIKGSFSNNAVPYAYPVSEHSLMGSSPAPEPFDCEPYAINKPGFFGSLWDGFRSTVSGVYEEAKEIAPGVMDVYKTIQEIKRPVDNTALVIRETPRAELPRTDYVMSTPYQRQTSGAKPASISIPPGGKAALSMPLILVGAGLIFLMLKKR
jgi:hypothetical protein